MIRALILLSLILALMIAAIILMNRFDPNVRALESARLAADQQHVKTLADFWAYTQMTCLGAVSFIMIGLAITIVYGSFVRVHRVYPVWNALYPQLPANQNTNAINEPGSQRIAAFSWWRGRMSQANWAKMVNGPDMPVEELVEPEPAQLPAVSPSVYSCALPPELSLGVGVNLNGEMVTYPLEDLGGVVVGGLTGMGKSDLLAAMLVYLARQAGDGKRLQFAIADLKDGVDFSGLPKDLPLLAYPVVYDREGASNLINQVLAEMSRRNQMLRERGVKHIANYNRVASEPMPYLIFLIDELAELMVKNGIPQETEDALVSLANRGRNVGISQIVATQRPAADTIPTRLRDASGTRVALACASKFHSMAILDQSGAEHLPRQAGYALLWHGGEPAPVRTFYAALRDGRVDEFFDKLPRRGALQTQMASDTVALQMPASVPVAPLIERARQVLPDTLDESVKLSSEQRRYIWALLQETDRGEGIYSISAVQTRLWPDLQRGGQKYKVLAKAVQEEARRHKVNVISVPGRGIRLHA
jgi:DNA segregation ATPase FtsK/SpoIIIE-like protein